MTGFTQKYLHKHGFDQVKLNKELGPFIQKHVKGAAPNAVELSLRTINRLGADQRVTDIRYMAYMLATACHESRETRRFQSPVMAKGRPVIDAKTNLPQTKQIKLWVIFDPINELGKGEGLRYEYPVKVHPTPEGALITERDGDQFMARNNGTTQTLSGKGLGVNHGVTESKIYLHAKGEAVIYYGRGLVQLTWWSGYAVSSVKLGMGLELLFNPDRVLEYDISYEIMVRGMIEGGWFTRDSCKDFLADSKTDYSGARDIINPRDEKHRELVAGYALAFEKLLMDTRAIAPAASIANR
jgi:hypothetical protein